MQNLPAAQPIAAQPGQVEQNGHDLSTARRVARADEPRRVGGTRTTPPLPPVRRQGVTACPFDSALFDQVTGTLTRAGP
jgi:hypothetical protein